MMGGGTMEVDFTFDSSYTIQSQNIHAPPKFNSEFSPEKLPKPNRKGSSSNHYFSGASC